MGFMVFVTSTSKLRRPEDQRKFTVLGECRSCQLYANRLLVCVMLEQHRQVRHRVCKGAIFFF